MVGYKLLYLVSLVMFSVGAFVFCILTLFYWRQRRVGTKPDRSLVLPAFTLACVSAFLINLLIRIGSALAPNSPWFRASSVALELPAGLLPPLLFHLIYKAEERHVPVSRAWRWLLVAFYLVSAAGSLLRIGNDVELIAIRWDDELQKAPAAMLAAAGGLALLIQTASRRRLTMVERHHRWWNSILLGLILVCAILDLGELHPFLTILPDYLLLSLFCVTLYYRERLVFFDLVIKRGVFFGVGLAGAMLFVHLGAQLPGGIDEDWTRLWIAALLVSPLWLMAPWAYSRLAHGIDHVWLRRRYSLGEAERKFSGDIQISTTEEDLGQAAERSLSDIFQASASVHFSLLPEPPRHIDGLVAELERDDTRLGWLALSERPDCIPFMSDDRRLLQSLAHTLGVVLENVRFRQQRQQQEDREQQLRWLASRAELKALRAQINPHFLFNALNAIAGLIPCQPQLADETIERLAQIFRYTLRKSNIEWSRLDEEVEFVTAYLRVEQARFGERLQLEFEMDPVAAGVPVPAMSIQPLVENAVKHGVSAVAGRAAVSLRAAVKNDVLWVEVFDNGPGFPSDFSLTGQASGLHLTGHGLRNVAERLKGYYGESAELCFESGTSGTRVVMKIPAISLADVAGRQAGATRVDRR